MKLHNLKIGPRLALAFGAVLILLVAVVLLGLRNMAASNDRLVYAEDVSNARLNAATDMRNAERTMDIALRDLVLVTGEAEMAGLAKEIDAARSAYDEAAGRLDKLMHGEHGRDILARIAGARAAALPLIDKVEALGRQNQNEQATALLRKELVPATERWLKAIGEIVDLQTRHNHADRLVAEQQYQATLWWVIAISVGAVGMAVAVAWLITRSVTRPIGEAVRVAQTVAAGDLTSTIEVRGADETSQLLLALKNMNISLQNIVGRVRVGTDAIATGSAQIASGNLDLSSRTEEQASSLEETASSMEELTSTVRQNAENARQANQLALSASTVATRGGAVVDSVVQTMDAINGSASKIVDIISVIDGIAFQTNILALNAAVEAARAGEQGRGFAVVASEVRNLAQRSASAAKEIKLLINDSVDKVGEGSRLVGEAGSTMREILVSVQRVTDIMGEITIASREQESGIEQINTAIGEMDSVTQQNAALVEEAAAAANSLQDQSAGLAEMVAMFKLPQDAQPRAAAAAGQASARPELRLVRSERPVRARGRVGGSQEWEAF